MPVQHERGPLYSVRFFFVAKDRISSRVKKVVRYELGNRSTGDESRVERDPRFGPARLERPFVLDMGRDGRVAHLDEGGSVGLVVPDEPLVNLKDVHTARNPGLCASASTLPVSAATLAHRGGAADGSTTCRCRGGLRARGRPRSCSGSGTRTGHSHVERVPPGVEVEREEFTAVVAGEGHLWPVAEPADGAGGDAMSRDDDPLQMRQVPPMP